MLPEDVFCRAAVYPRFLVEDSFDEEALLQFSQGSRYIKSLSLASLWLCQGKAGVHDFGERVAAAGNQREIERRGALTAETQNHYLGYYSFVYRMLAEISRENFYIRLYWREENGDSRHFQLDLIPNEREFTRLVCEQIEEEKASAEREGRKIRNEPNVAKRVKRLVDSDVSVIRERVARIIFGPELAPLEVHDVRIDLQRRYMQERKVSARPQVG